MSVRLYSPFVTHATRAGFAPDVLVGRVAVVTGAAAGIGLAIAEMLLDLGATVVAVDRDSDALGRNRTLDAGGRAVRRVFDLADLEAIEGLVAEVTDDQGPVSILVNAAGITGKPLLQTSLADWDSVLAVDLTAPFLLIQAVGRRMIDAGGGGNIVNIGSSSAHRAVQSGTAYGAAKAGLASLTRTAAWELGPHGINVNLVAPGLTRTPLTEGVFGSADALNAAVQGSGPLMNLLGRVSEPEDVAAVVGFLCLPGSRQITGQVIHTSAGAIVASS